MWGRRSSEASERFAERRQREDSAPRLAASIPTLESLKLEIRETTSSTLVCPEATHIRRIVVEHAPALFFVMCHDSYCQDGGHDLSRGILLALREKKTHFGGEDRCNGRIGSSDCQRTLHYVGTATYRPSSPK
jgi:hypothetical protein